MKIPKKIFNIKTAIVGAIISACCGLVTPFFASATMGSAITVSPMNYTMLLTPGETATESIRVSSPSGATNSVYYKVSIASFNAMDGTEDYSIDSNTITERNEIMKWIHFDQTEGYVSPNETISIPFTITVPDDAPAGGQYASIVITASNDNEVVSQGQGAMIKENMAISSYIYANVAGESYESGEIQKNSFPTFLLAPPLKTEVLVKNTGNVHSEAVTTLQVFPLFSDEEVYTNEEKPIKPTVIPNQTYYFSNIWENTPLVGIFKVRQTVEFAGQNSVSEKFVIICPIWLLFIIIFAIIAIIIWLMAKSKSRKKARR